MQYSVYRDYSAKCRLYEFSLLQHISIEVKQMHSYLLYADRNLFSSKIPIILFDFGFSLPGQALAMSALSAWA